MIPVCFENYIGIASCIPDQPIPKSRLYINDLEGITNNLGAAIVSGEDVSGLNLMRKKIDFATGLVIEDLRAYIAPYFSIETVIDSFTAGLNDGNYLNYAPLERGLRIRKTKTNLQTLRLINLRIMVSDTVEGKVIKIIDGNLVTEYEVDLVAGEEYNLHLDYIARNDVVRIVMDNSDVRVNDGGFFESKSGCNCSCLYTGSYAHLPYMTPYPFSKDPLYGGGYGLPTKSYSGPIRNTDVEVMGWNGTEKEKRNFGMSVDVSIECSLDSLACALSNHLRYVLLYKAGVEIVKEWALSDRINQYTTLDLDKAMFLSQRWEAEYDKRYKLVGASLQKVMRTMNDVCVTCKGLGYQYQI